ncbi:hypothetical protein JTB14_037530 [Gonioctena quinquepunctata]|nr:hypothetical protein JTB14_037530 [Gonioctena quinquepunctata]
MKKNHSWPTWNVEFFTQDFEINLFEQLEVFLIISLAGTCSKLRLKLNNTVRNGVTPNFSRRDPMSDLLVDHSGTDRGPNSIYLLPACQMDWKDNIASSGALFDPDAS